MRWTDTTPIDAPVDVVWRLTADVEAWPATTPTIRSVRRLDDGPLRVGSRVDFVARFLGRTIAYTYEVTELVPGELLVMSTAQGPFPMTTTYAFADLPSGSTRMTLRNHGSPSGFGAVAAPVMSRAMQRATTKDLARLHRLHERGQ